MNYSAIATACAIVLAAVTVAPAAKNAPKPYPLEPGDPAIHAYLTRLAVQLDGQFVEAHSVEYGDNGQSFAFVRLFNSGFR